MRFLLLGDICLFDAMDRVLSIAELSDREPDSYVANLETPLAGAAMARPKAGPTLRGDVRTLRMLSSRFEQMCLSLANNHIMDYGESGMMQTIEECRRLGIPVVGAGRDLQEARRPLRLDCGGVRIGMLGCCETQFGIASSSRGGVAPTGPGLCALIRSLRSEVDVVVVSIHGASEMCPWPSPDWQALLRSFVDAGAQIVHGHHSHVPQGYELYNGGHIFYGLGNFFVDPSDWDGQPNTLWSVVAECEVADGYVTSSVHPIDVRVAGREVQVRRVEDAEYQRKAGYLERCNVPLSDTPLLTGLWQEVALRAYMQWYRDWLKFDPPHVVGRPGFGDQIKSIAKCVRRGLAGSGPATKSEMLLWYHLFACQSHRDAIVTALGVLSGEIEDLRTSEIGRLVDEMMPSLRRDA